MIISHIFSIFVKNMVKWFGTITLLVVSGFSIIACDNSSSIDLPNVHPLGGVLGHGYDITDRYAYSPDIKSAILDLDKLLEVQRVVQDRNLKYGEFETITGKDINEYMAKITAKISYSTSANLMKVASFSNELGANFGTEQITKVEYAFTTSTSRIVTDAYIIRNRDGLDAFFTQNFKNDFASMSDQQLIAKYGTHVMTGGILGARADYHLSVKKREQNTITNLEAYAKAKVEAKYKVVNEGTGYSVESDVKFTQYFYTGDTLENTKVFGGKGQYGQFINDKQDYDRWIESIDGNEIWVDYYPQSLIPISDLITDKSRSDALMTAIISHCDRKKINVVSPPATATHFREPGGNNFAIKGGSERDWLISSSFDIDSLRSAGYTKFVLTLKFDAKNELIINAGSRLYASFWEGLAPRTTRKYGEKFWTPALSRWEAKEFIQEISLADFNNQLTIRWGTSANASFTVGTRSITIEAKK
jgi:hypothetical protein